MAKIIGWTYWGNDKYPLDGGQGWDDEEYEERRKTIADELRKNNYHWDGTAHQNALCGTPVFDDGVQMVFSMRQWGGIMATAYPDEIDNSDGYGYCEWAWDAPDESLVKYPPESEWLK